MCQPIVMIFVLSFHEELTSTMGPGSRYRRISESGKSLFRNVFIRRGPPNGSRLSCGALKKDSFHNLRAPSAQALVRRRRHHRVHESTSCGTDWTPSPRESDAIARELTE